MRGTVEEWGGGKVTILVDRDTDDYPTGRVSVIPLYERPVVDSFDRATSNRWVNADRLVADWSISGNPLKFMPPGHFCPDVCGIEDFGTADTWRGRTVRGFFRLMKLWPKPGQR